MQVRIHILEVPAVHWNTNSVQQGPQRRHRIQEVVHQWKLCAVCITVWTRRSAATSAKDDNMRLIDLDLCGVYAASFQVHYVKSYVVICRFSRLLSPRRSPSRH